jgi:hypothetical protein
MPKILVVTFFHMAVAVGSGLFLGLSVFGVGFSDSKMVHETYSALAVLWQILNAPAGIYVLNVVEPNWAVFCLLQAITSFVWANAFGLIVSFWKLRRRNKPLEPTR